MTLSFSRIFGVGHWSQLEFFPQIPFGRISRGESGIDDVTSSLCHVNVADARAFDPRDEEKVKRTIECTDAWS